MFLGCEIGGTKLQVGVCDRRGKVHALERRTVDRKKGATGILQQFTELIPPLVVRYRVRAIGVGFGGPYDLERQRTIKSHQIAGWDGYPLQSWFHRQFGLPTYVENDQNCSALAEATLGAGKGLRRVFYVTVGTGIGGGFVIDGKVDNGRFGAAEIGHTVIGTRRLEALASGLAIERGVSTVPQAARYLGFALANTIAIVNPDIVIVGGGVATAGEKFFRPLRQTVKRLVFPVFANNYRIVPPKLGQTVVVVGAALVAARKGR
ncbi:MAG: putative fructokinase [Verrucomicrobiae bacterium]|nr:putative fructokinase [Verrucomicrobiae bacterium]